MIKGHMMSLDVAEEFFEICAKVGAVTREERAAVLNELLHHRNIKILKEDQIKKVIKGKKVLRIK